MACHSISGSVNTVCIVGKNGGELTRFCCWVNVLNPSRAIGTDSEDLSLIIVTRVISDMAIMFAFELIC